MRSGPSQAEVAGAMSGLKAAGDDLRLLLEVAREPRAADLERASGVASRSLQEATEKLRRMVRAYARVVEER